MIQIHVTIGYIIKAEIIMKNDRITIQKSTWNINNGRRHMT